MLEPVPPRELASYCPQDHVHYELMRPPAVRQSLDRLLGLFAVSRDRVVLGEDMEDVAMNDLNQARMGLPRLALSVTYTHRTQSPSVRNLSDSPKFLVTHLGLLLREEAHCETVEATLRSLDSTADRRSLHA